MVTLRILEYLFYLIILIILIKSNDCASVNKKQLASQNVLSSTLERTLTEERDSDHEREHVREHEHEHEHEHKNEHEHKSENESDRYYVRNNLKECKQAFSWMCLKIEFLKVLDRLAEQDEIQILKGLSLVKDNTVKELRNSDILADVARNYPSNPHIKLNGYLLSKVHNYLRTHYLRLRFLDAQTIVEARSVVEARGKGGGGGGKKGNNHEAMMAVALMMKGTLMAMGMAGIALIAGKALVTALMALTLAAALGIRGMSKTTYEVVAKPVFSHSMHSMTYEDPGQHHMGSGGTSGFGGGYSRSMNLKTPQHMLLTEKM